MICNFHHLITCLNLNRLLQYQKDKKKYKGFFSIAHEILILIIIRSSRILNTHVENEL